MSARIRNISIDCHDTYALAGFWAQVFGTGRQPDDLPGDPEAMVLTADGETVLFLQVPEGKPGEPRTGHHRFHLDLMPTDQTRDEEVERLLGLGASLVGDHRKPDGTGWVVLADPEGNEFCVERSPAERALAI